jgi:hypothetical protein
MIKTSAMMMDEDVVCERERQSEMVVCATKYLQNR